MEKVHTNSNGIMSLRRHLDGLSLLGVLFCMMAGMSTVWAASPVQQLEQLQREQDRIQREQRERVERDRREELLKQPHTGLQVDVPEAPAKVDQGPCRDVNEIAIEGATLLPDTARGEITSPFIGQCMTVYDIERLLGEITRYYVDKGFIAARAYLQPQDLAAGILRILVVEGAVEKIMREGGDDDGNVNLLTAFPGVTGDPFNLRDFEQGLDQINRLLSNDATMDIKPGENAGGSLVIIRNQPSRRLRASLSYDNHGGTSTGEDQAGLSVSLDNPLWLNDSINISHLRTTQGELGAEHSRSNSFYYSVPMGYLTLTGSYIWTDYATTISPISGDLVADGYTETSALSTEYVAYRDAVNRVSLNGTLAVNTTKNFLADQLLDVSSRRLSTLDLGVTWNTRLLNGSLWVNLDYMKGLTMFNALRDIPDLPSELPHAQFRKWTAGASWVKPFQIGRRNFTFSTSLSAQVGTDVLFGSEQFSIGSIYSVRGYRNTSISGDTGFYLRNDLSMPFNVEAAGLPLYIEPFIGYDVGSIRDRHAAIGGRLTGMAVGISASSEHISLDVSGVRPVSMPDQLKDEGFQLFAKLTISI